MPTASAPIEAAVVPCRKRRRDVVFGSAVTGFMHMSAKRFSGQTAKCQASCGDVQKLTPVATCASGFPVSSGDSVVDFVETPDVLATDRSIDSKFHIFYVRLYARAARSLVG